MSPLLLYAGLAFLFGSIPFGFILARLKNVDIRRQGSGNIGATNVYRILGAGFGILTFTLDFTKGFLPAYLTFQVPQYHQEPYGILIGACAVIGHMFSPFLVFKGGRGVATGLGVTLAVTPPVAGVALLLWLPSLILTRYMSLSCLIGVWSTPLSAYAFYYEKDGTEKIVLLYLLISTLITIKHLPNIRRLLRGSEHRFQFTPRKAQGEGDHPTPP